MLHNYRNSTLFLTLLLTLLCTCVRAQTPIAVMDFDGTATEMGLGTDVLFFDNGADGFFGIHNANADDTDGTPMDTGDGNMTDIALITSTAITGDFLFVNDLDDTGDSEGNLQVNGTTGFATVTFGPVNVVGLTNLLFSFDYQVVGFDSNDDVFYQLVLDGVAAPEVQLVNGVSGSSDDIADHIDIVIPNGTTSVSLLLKIKQNTADDQGAFDNFTVTADNTGIPCGVTAFGPNATASCAAFTNGVADAYTLDIDYTGVEAGATLELLVDGNPASSFTNNGDDPATTAGGTVMISSPDLLEGTAYEVTLTNPSGNCAYSVSGSLANNACVSVCELSTDVSMLRLLCTTLTNGSDIVIGSLDYNGIELGAVATITPGGLISNPTNPGTMEDGEINFGLLAEGVTYTITISGGACSGGDAIVITFTVPADLCTPSDLVINEVLPNPTGGVDVNMDGATNSDDEFIELYNNGTSDIDLSGYVVEEFAGARHTFEPGTILAPGDGIMIIADTFIVDGVPLLTASSYGCSWVEAEVTFIGLNNTGTDGVIVRNASGNIVAQMSYTDAPAGSSLALSPDGNLAGGYQDHTTISTSGAQSSPCSENIDNSIALPLELLSFTAYTAGKNVSLSWSTTNEIDNDHFVVERRMSNEEWEAIGRVAAGSAAANTYDFTDENPLNGDNYYRLRQVDVDGSAALYGPVMAAFRTTEFRVYPNPATNEIRFGGAWEATDRISLISASGRVLRVLAPGVDRAAIQDLPRGIYLLRIERSAGTEVVRFVKQ